MRKSIKAVVITPDSYANGRAFPVVYLLHGYSGNQTDWIKKVPAITSYSDQCKVIIVCPDGNFSSWYFDSPEDTSFKYETYISGELVKWIDDHYKTVKDRKGRAITGLSMGGHGALFLAIKHQEVFGLAGSMSGGVDLRPFPLNWDIAKRLGDYARYPERWDSNSVINLTYLLKPNGLALIIDCGTEDFFFHVNEELHRKLLERNIPHDYLARPGGHTWEYWADAFNYQMVFIKKYFNSYSR
ncbi:MAG TPA: alpha/beta hydrolase family protein [Bacteroidales bacterium]